MRQALFALRESQSHWNFALREIVFCTKLFALATVVRALGGVRLFHSYNMASDHFGSMGSSAFRAFYSSLNPDGPVLVVLMVAAVTELLQWYRV